MGIEIRSPELLLQDAEELLEGAKHEREKGIGLSLVAIGRSLSQLGSEGNEKEMLAQLMSDNKRLMSDNKSLMGEVSFLRAHLLDIFSTVMGEPTTDRYKVSMATPFEPMIDQEALVKAYYELGLNHEYMEWKKNNENSSKN